MFFIGIFGIDNKFKEIKVLNNFSCKNCNISNGASLVNIILSFIFSLYQYLNGMKSIM